MEQIQNIQNNFCCFTNNGFVIQTVLKENSLFYKNLSDKHDIKAYDVCDGIVVASANNKIYILDLLGHGVNEKEISYEIIDLKILCFEDIKIFVKGKDKIIIYDKSLNVQKTHLFDSTPINIFPHKSFIFVLYEYYIAVYGDAKIKNIKIFDENRNKHIKDIIFHKYDNKFAVLLNDENSKCSIAIFTFKNNYDYKVSYTFSMDGVIKIIFSPKNIFLLLALTYREVMCFDVVHNKKICEFETGYIHKDFGLSIDAFTLIILASTQKDINNFHYVLVYDMRNYRTPIKIIDLYLSSANSSLDLKAHKFLGISFMETEKPLPLSFGTTDFLFEPPQQNNFDLMNHLCIQPTTNMNISMTETQNISVNSIPPPKDILNENSMSDNTNLIDINDFSPVCDNTNNHDNPKKGNDIVTQIDPLNLDVNFLENIVNYFSGAGDDINLTAASRDIWAKSDIMNQDEDSGHNNMNQYFEDLKKYVHNEIANLQLDITKQNSDLKFNSQKNFERIEKLLERREKSLDRMEKIWERVENACISISNFPQRPAF